ncbi:GNAT family N-acetyltransferase [Actinoplanes rectilineatus]|uniref:GNAT family N-acetyltransferase n=1 Tax=Actinoplanes rectilineatus TaxID=113571 RepID=UPI0005F2B109|nr:GNAT family protein [Actinoplanes rectilineatus]
MFSISLGGGAELRPLEPWNAVEFLEHMDRARATVDPWIPWASVSTDLPSATATLQRYADKRAADTGGLFGIWLDGTLVGGTMFTSFDTGSGNCEVGCWLEPAGTGRGLITTAVRVLIDWAIRERGMHRVEWLCDPDNTASANVARRLGMTAEGRKRESYPWQGRRRDTEIWALLAPEWLADKTV